MTEDEAKTKRCVHRGLDRGSINHCVGSECMAWRWTEGKAETMKAYHSQWSSDDRMKAHEGISIDGGENWRYEYTHGDADGTYDIWYRTNLLQEQVNGYCGLAGKL